MTVHDIETVLDEPTGEDAPGQALASGGPRGVLAGFLPQTPVQRVVLGLAVAFLTGALGYFIGVRSEQDSPPEDSADVGFLYDMIPHHQQALEIATLQLVNGSDPSAMTFAREILRTQSYEVGLMSMRLGEWGHDPAEAPDQAMEWMGMISTHDTMPGIARPDEMAALRDARGAEADALFYALMIDHHRGGVHMADAAAEQAEDDWVVEAASRMARIQALEINEMLLARDRAGLPADPEPFAPDFADDGALIPRSSDGELPDTGDGASTDAEHQHD